MCYTLKYWQIFIEYIFGKVFAAKHKWMNALKTEIIIAWSVCNVIKNPFYLISSKTPKIILAGLNYFCILKMFILINA